MEKEQYPGVFEAFGADVKRAGLLGMNAARVLLIIEFVLLLTAAAMVATSAINLSQVVKLRNKQCEIYDTVDSRDRCNKEFNHALRTARSNLAMSICFVVIMFIVILMTATVTKDIRTKTDLAAAYR